MIDCCICGSLIVKYELDLGDTVFIELPSNVNKYICDDCAKDIAKQLIER